MNNIYQHYIIDLSSNNNFVQIPTVQGDGNNIRGFEVELIENGVQYEIDKNDCIITIMGTKPDTSQVMNDCTVSDEGYILVDITSQMSAVKGRGDYQIVLMSKSTNSQLKSFPFYIFTTSAAFDIDYIVSTDEFQSLTRNIIRTEEVIEEANDAISDIRVLETSVENAEKNRVNAEKNRVNAEKNRATAESARQSNEDTRKLNELARQTAETNRNNAESERENAERTRITNENTRQNNEATRQSNENIRQTNTTTAITNADKATERANNATERANNAATVCEGIIGESGIVAQKAAEATNSANAAAISAANALTSEKNAKTSETNASKSKTAAATSATNAEASATIAGTKATEASTYATQSKSYAVGGTGTRTGENSDNAKYYYEQSKGIYDNFNSAGNVTGVKGNSESSYRTGNVNLTPANIGALASNGNAVSATKLATARTIDGVNFDGSAAITHYGTCNTAAATAAKVVALTGFVLGNGATLKVKFTVTNTATNPTLNVNGSGAKAIFYRGAAIPAGYLAANRVYEFVYDGTNYELIGDINTDTNTKVTQTNTTTAADYRMLFSTNANDTNETNTVRKSANFLANPSTGEFYAKGFRRIDITGQTLDIDTLTLSSGSPQIMRYIERTDGGAANITNIPVAGKPFILDVELIRWNTTADYISRQTFRNAANYTLEYVRLCTNGTWSNWQTRRFTDTTYTPASAAPLAPGTAAVGTSAKYAREDHVHPAQTSVSGSSGSCTGNAATATKLATSRTIAVAGDIVGSGSFDGSTNLSISATRRGAIVGQSSGTVSESSIWYQVGYYESSTANEDVYISFHVYTGYGDKTNNVGILSAHFRTGSTVGTHSSAELVWEYALSGISPGNFVLAYSSVSGIMVYALYVKCDVAWQSYHFDVISEGKRGSRNTNTWKLNSNVSSTGGSPQPSAWTKIYSSFTSIRFGGVLATDITGIATMFKINVSSGYHAFMTNHFIYSSDNVASLGSASIRWKQLYAGTTTISTSDRNQKDDITPISDKYIELFMKLQPVSFTFKDNTSGRTHIGFISQDVEAAMEEVGLDSLDFAGFCKDKKQKTVKAMVPMYDNEGKDVLDEEGNIVTCESEVWEDELDENGNVIWIYSLRYSEFIALNTAMIQRQQASINRLEESINNLERKISALEKLTSKDEGIN